MEEVFLEVCCAIFRTYNLTNDFLPKFYVFPKLFRNSWIGELAWDLVIQNKSLRKKLGDTRNWRVSCNVFSIAHVIHRDTGSVELYRRIFAEKGIKIPLEIRQFLVNRELISMAYKYLGQEIERYCFKVMKDIMYHANYNADEIISAFIDICGIEKSRLEEYMWSKVYEIRLRKLYKRVTEVVEILSKK